MSADDEWGPNNGPMPETAMRIIRSYAAEIVQLRTALRTLNEWCPSYAPNQDEINRLLAKDRRAGTDVCEVVGTRCRVHHRRADLCVGDR